MITPAKYSRGSAYLSGGMQFAKNLGADWRIECADKLTSMGYYPIDICKLDRAYAKQYGELYFPEDQANHLQYKANMRQHFVHADLELVKNDSDFLIILYDESVRRGAGTTSEAQVAYLHNIPVFLVSTYEDWYREVPGWLQALCVKVFPNFSQLYDYLDNLPYGILKKDVYGNHGVDGQYLCSLCGAVFEKHKHHFVSKVQPLLCGNCVDLTTKTFEGHTDRYNFIVNYLEREYDNECMEELKGMSFEKDSCHD